MAKKETGFYMDISKFLTGLDRGDKRFKDSAADGLFLEGAKVIKNAIEEKPRAPHLEGHLWRSQRVKKMGVKKDAITLYVGFNVPYAAKLHEALNVTNWTLAGSGPKYLSSKLTRHKEEHMKNVAGFIKGKMK